MTLALRMLKSREDAEEAAQDAFVRAYRGLKDFRREAKFGTWLYRIVYNVCLSKLDQRRNDFTSIEYDDESAERLEPGAWYDDEGVEAADMAAFVRRAIELLPSKYGTIVSLFYLQELSLEEISGVTDLPVGTVKVRLHRARALLLEEVGKEFHNVREVS